MNIKSRPESQDSFTSLQLLDEISKGAPVTQRDLSNRLGIALGLINSYIKNLVAKGFITIKAIPPKRYIYYLTPKGFTEKTRLTYDLLQDYTRIYREAKNNFESLFRLIEDEGKRDIVFAGADEVAEIAFITLQQTSMRLTGILDDEKNGENFFGKKILPLADIRELEYDCIVVTSYLRYESLYQQIMGYGIETKDVRGIFGP